MIPGQSIPPEMLDYVRQVAREMRVDENTAWAMIQGGEGGASTPPPITGQPTTGQPAPTYQPQQPMQPPGRRDRAAEVAQSMTAMRPPSPDTGLMAELKKMMAERDKPQATLGSKLGEALGLDYSKKRTLGDLAFEGLADAFGSTDEKDKAVKAATKNVNEFAPVSVAEQMAKKKNATLGTSLANLFIGPPQPGQRPKTTGPTLWTTLFG